MNTISKCCIGITLSLSMFALGGCGSSTPAQSTAEEVQAFRGDRSKMPADVKERMQKAQQGARPGRPTSVPAQ
jgi:hypothetical protein